MSREPAVLLHDHQMASFVSDGYITLMVDKPESFHEDIHRQIESIYGSSGNPGNDILPMVSPLREVLKDARVAGALTSILGPGYMLHPHRHCHLNPAGSEGQALHMDSYEADENVRHHRTRWAMAFYYPQDVTEEMGPTTILPGSQYFVSDAYVDEQTELPLSGQAGTFTIVHYDLWHRAAANLSTVDRYMVKFLFCRTSEPDSPTWDANPGWAPEWRRSPGNAPHSLLDSIWQWHLGEMEYVPPGHVPLDRAIDAVSGSSETAALGAAYTVDREEPGAATTLLEELRHEVTHEVEKNLASSHTNPCQFRTSLALGALGIAATECLTEALKDDDCYIRAAAADILGDMGRKASGSVRHLVAATTDDSDWVRRNAAEALGNIGAPGPGAIDALGDLLGDPCSFVRLNAVYALGKLGEAGRRRARVAVIKPGPENQYVTSFAGLLKTTA